MERLEQPRANELGAHPAARIDDLDHGVRVLETQIEKHRHAVRARLDGVLYEMNEGLLERLAVGQREARVPRYDHDLVLRSVLLGNARDDALESDRSRCLSALRSVSPEPREQHLELLRA